MARITKRINGTFKPAVVVALIATGLYPAVLAQACAGGTAQEFKGNWYCSAVDGITYVNFPGTGSYHKVTKMDAATGECTTAVHQYSGSLSPLNEELSLHFRGPLNLHRLAVYAPAASSHGSKEKRAPTHHKHAHHHVKGNLARPFTSAKHLVHRFLHSGHNGVPIDDTQLNIVEQRAVGDMVTATIDGQVVSWVNTYAGPNAATNTPVQATEVSVINAASKAAPAPAPIAAVKAAIAQNAVSGAAAKTAVASAEATPENPSAKETSESDKDETVASWTRHAYYEAASGTAEGLTFLNHFGGTNGIPGTADGGAAFGDSLSYASADGQSGAASPQVLANAMITDDTEVIVMSNVSCADGDCGYTRPGGVAYHGFGGDHKLFLFEFTMPMTGKTTFNGDMPAIWALNAQIPLTSQYGTNQQCSCWTFGCGEADFFEILDSGNTRCKSTLHMAPAGGSSDFFSRPTGQKITAAVIFDGKNEKMGIRVLDGGATFAETMAEATISGWMDGNSSIFKMQM